MPDEPVEYVQYEPVSGSLCWLLVRSVLGSSNPRSRTGKRDVSECLPIIASLPRFFFPVSSFLFSPHIFLATAFFLPPRSGTYDLPTDPPLLLLHSLPSPTSCALTRCRSLL